MFFKTRGHCGTTCWCTNIHPDKMQVLQLSEQPAVDRLAIFKLGEQLIYFCLEYCLICRVSSNKLLFPSSSLSARVSRLPNGFVSIMYGKAVVLKYLGL